MATTVEVGGWGGGGGEEVRVLHSVWGTTSQWQNKTGLENTVGGGGGETRGKRREWGQGSGRAGGYLTGDDGTRGQSSGAVWQSRWPSWAVRPNEPSGFRGRKELLNSALVSRYPQYVNWHLRTLSITTYLRGHPESDEKAGSWRGGGGGGNWWQWDPGSGDGCEWRKGGGDN